MGINIADDQCRRNGSIVTYIIQYNPISDDSSTILPPTDYAIVTRARSAEGDEGDADTNIGFEDEIRSSFKRYFVEFLFDQRSVCRGVVTGDGNQFVNG